MQSRLAHGVGILILGAMSIGSLKAVTITQKGTFSTDDQLFQILFNVPTAQTLVISTTSYGGGTNLDSTIVAAGGFVPVISLFSSTGAIVGSDGGDGMAGGCRGGAKADVITKMCDDAYLMTTLSAGNYTLVLSEFPNVALGNLSDGFLFTGSPTITGSICGSASGTLLETDVAPCVQRTGSFAVNIGTVPEPSTVWLAGTVALGFLYRRRRFFLS